MVLANKFTFWLDDELTSAVDTLAGAERRTRSQMIRVLLEEALAAREGTS